MNTYSTLYKQQKLIAWVDLSTYCNASCPQCHRTNPEGLDKVDWLPLVQWSLKDFTNMFPIKTLNNYAQFDVCGTWGDPIMNKDIFEICKYILSNSDSTIKISTNGGIRSESWWWELGVLSKLHSNRITVVFDIDGTTNEQHQKYRRGVDLNTVIENLSSFTSTGAMAHIFTVAFEHNQHNLHDIAILSKNAGAVGMGIVVSNRFEKKNQTEFNFKYNGIEEKLNKSTLNLGNWYWVDLNNEDQLDELYKLSMVEIKKNCNQS
jgi:MoaA/NifB/PqqE/SkfB family radical SAM enzyme